MRGRGGHAARRNEIDDSVTAMAEMVMRTTAMNTPSCVLSIGRVIAEGATNVIPPVVSSEGTMRTFDREERERIHALLRAVGREVESKYGVTVEVDINHGYPCVVNDVMLSYEAMIVATDEGVTVKELQPMTAAEDFGHYTERYPSL